MKVEAVLLRAREIRAKSPMGINLTEALLLILIEQVEGTNTQLEDLCALLEDGKRDY